MVNGIKKWLIGATVFTILSLLACGTKYPTTQKMKETLKYNNKLERERRKP